MVCDSQNTRDNAAECPEDGHVRPLARMQHQAAHLFAARQASYPGKHEPNLKQRALPQARACRKGVLALEGVQLQPKVHRLKIVKKSVLREQRGLEPLTEKDGGTMMALLAYAHHHS